MGLGYALGLSEASITCPFNICSGWALLYSLSIQLQMFVNKYNIPTLSEAHNVFRDIMVTEVRSLFVDVEQLIRLMLLCPVSSCAAERSFGALRRLKNWLRSIT